MRKGSCMITSDYSKTKITGGFWQKKQEMLRKTTVWAVYDRFKETGRFDAFRCDWKEGMPNKPHIFWDSDVAKWIEGAAYITRQKKDAKLEKIVDEVVDLIVKNQEPCGYFNTYYQTQEPENIFTNRDNHELYCAGHLIEAAVAYYEATGKRKFLDAMCCYADYIEKRFKIDRDTGFRTPGHEEIELALVKLYDCTGEKRYLELALFFLNERGVQNDSGDKLTNCFANQSHAPVREQKEAVGHAVRAGYLYCAMADVALRTGDKELKAACERIFDNIVNKKMYITGGVGSSAACEAYTVDYDLPNVISYTETCAAISVALFAMRMLKFDADSKYSDAIERIIYNGFLSSVSLDGKAFFYENPLEIIPYMHTRDRDVSHVSIHLPRQERSEVFLCSCCPPNIVRFIPSIANMLYTYDDDTVFVHQFMQSTTQIDRNGESFVIEQKTSYPQNGKVKITVKGADTRLAVRIPFWCDSDEYQTVKGYQYFDVKDGQSIELDFKMKVQLVEARPEAVFDCGRYAVMRGPVVYCMEAIDNTEYLRDIRIDSHARFRTGKNAELGVPTLTVKAYCRNANENAPLYSPKHDSFRVFDAVLIPYYAFANRGASAMQVWHLVK